MKNKIRSVYKDIRHNIKDKEYLSSIIFNKIINDSLYKDSNIIGLYSNLEDEVSTKELLKYSLDNKIVALPKVEGPYINFYKIDKSTILTKGSYNIYEPSNNNLIIPDLVIVPGISFDIKRNRLGFGKGYYDKYLKDKSIKKIGICFDNQIYNNILPTNNLDIKMDKIITDKRIY